MSALGRAALAYVRQGIAVFPLHPGGKTPMTRYGFKSATLDEDRIVHWWTTEPHANIGAPTGITFDTLDVDVKIHADGTTIKDARPSMHRLNAHGLLAGCIGIATTRHDGYHLYYPPSGLPSASIDSLHIDFKAVGGYIVLPPSKVKPDGPTERKPKDPQVVGSGIYQWVDEYDHAKPGQPFDWSAAKNLLHPDPEVLVPGITSVWEQFTQRTSDPTAGLVNHLRKQGDGNRNKSLFWAACRAYEDNLDLADIVAAARDIGLDDTEITKTINSARDKTGKA